jgi:hypothetical protein
VASQWSIGSRNSLLSIGSAESVLSIGSVGSALSIGSTASFASIGSHGSALSVLSTNSFASFASAFSSRSSGARSASQARGDDAARYGALTLGFAATAGAAWWLIGRGLARRRLA